MTGAFPSFTRDQNKKSWPHPRGAPPLSEKGEKQKWDYELGDWVVCADQLKRKADEVLHSNQEKYNKVEDESSSKVEELDERTSRPRQRPRRLETVQVIIEPVD